MSDNWKKGKRGFQSSLNDIQQKELFNFWIQNDWENSPAREMLKRLYGIKLADRTLALYKKRLRKIWEESSNSLDRIVDWNDFALLHTHNIPSHLLSPLRRMADSIELTYLSGDRTFLTPEYMKPTYRNLKWWAYITQYYGDFITDYSDRQLIAEQYALREFRSEFAGSEFITEDLDKWLMIRPWESEERETSYLKWISEGKFPTLQFSFENYGYNQAFNTSEEIKKSAAMGLYVVNKWISEYPKPYLLPSQIRENYRETVEKSKSNS